MRDSISPAIVTRGLVPILFEIIVDHFAQVLRHIMVVFRSEDAEGSFLILKNTSRQLFCSRFVIGHVHLLRGMTHNYLPNNPAYHMITDAVVKFYTAGPHHTEVWG